MNSINTGIWHDYAFGGMARKSGDLPPLNSPVAKSAALLELFNKAVKTLPPIDQFPLDVRDERVAARMRLILGLSHNSPYYRVNQWLAIIRKLVGEDFIKGEYITGSAATYIAGQPVLREALERFLEYVDASFREQLRTTIESKIYKSTFPFADVDLRLHVDESCPFAEIHAKINQIPGCRADLIEDKMVIIYVGDDLDIVLWKRGNHLSSNLEDFIVDIKQSNLFENNVRFISRNPWKWFCGHTIKILENYSDDPSRVMQRLDWQVTRGKVTTEPTLSKVFDLWQATIENNPYQITSQIDKHHRNHDSEIPIVPFLMRLMLQQRMIYGKATKQELKESANVRFTKSIPSFLKSLFHVMKETHDIASVHAIIESVAAVALYEGWKKKPFGVKLVMHEGQWMFRMRFVWGNYKRDLLVRFDVSSALARLYKITPAQWEKMRLIVHSLWIDGGPISQRVLSKDYRNIVKARQIDDKVIDQIKDKLLNHLGKQKRKELNFAKITDLASLEIEWGQDRKEFLNLGKIIFENYSNRRLELCWSIVDKCINHCWFDEAAEMINMLGAAKEEPPRGYTALFALAVQKRGSSALLAASCPFSGIKEERWLELSTARDKDKNSILLSLMNESDVSARVFLELMRLLKIDKPEISEKVLLRVLKYERYKTHERICAHDKETFVSEEYTAFVSHHILSNKSVFEPSWIAGYLLSGRFSGTQEEKILLCKYLLAKAIPTGDKAKLLEKFEIQDKEMWQAVANECVGQEDKWVYHGKAEFEPHVLVALYEIVNNCDSHDFVQKKLAGIKVDAKTLNIVLIRIFKNWQLNKRAAVNTIKLLCNAPFPWEKIVENARSGEHILENIFKLDMHLKIFPFYSALFRATKTKNKDRWQDWVTMALQYLKTKKPEEILPTLASAVFSECFDIIKDSSQIILKMVAHTTEGVHLINDTLNQVDQNLLLKMLETILEFDPDGSMGAKLFMKYFDPKKCDKDKFKGILGEFAKRILAGSHGDVMAAGKMWQVAGDLAVPKEIPDECHLIDLIKEGFPEFVLGMVQALSREERDAISPGVYCQLIGSLKTVKKQYAVLEVCSTFSEGLQKQWISLAEREEVGAGSSLELLKSAKKLMAPVNQVQKCALRALAALPEENVVMDDDLIEYLLDITSTLEIDSAYELWEALRKSNRVEKSRWLLAGLAIVNKHPESPHFNLIRIIMQNAAALPQQLLFECIVKMTDYPLEPSIRKLFLPYVKSRAIEGDSALYWKLDCDENISAQDIEKLKPTNKQLYFMQQRLVETCKKCPEISLYHSIINIARCSETVVDDVFAMIVDFIPTITEEAKKSEAVRDAFYVLYHNSEEISKSLSKQRLFNILVDNYKYLFPKDWNSLAYLYISGDDLKCKNIDRILTVLATNGSQRDFQLAILGFAKENNSRKIPLRALFMAILYPECIPSINIEKLSKINQAFFTLVLSGSMVVQTKDVKDAKWFTSALSEFLILADQQFWKRESAELEFIGSKCRHCMYETSKLENLIGKEQMHLFVFIHHVFKTAGESAFYDADVFAQFVSIIGSKNEFKLECFQALIHKMLLDSLTTHFDPSCFKALDLILCSYSSLYLNKISDETALVMMNAVLSTIAHLIVSHPAVLRPLTDKCIEMIFMFTGRNLQKHHDLLTIAYASYLLLAGKVDGFFVECSRAVEINGMTMAVKELCDVPHAENLQKAQEILYAGLPNHLLIVNRIEGINEVYTKALIKGSDDIAKSFPFLFFYYLDDWLGTECFEFSDKRLDDCLKFYQQLQDERAISNPAAFKKQIVREFHEIRLKCIHNNVIDLLGARPDLLPQLIDFLSSFIIKGLLKSYEEFPAYFRSLVDVLYNASDRFPNEKNRLHYKLAIFQWTHPLGSNGRIAVTLDEYRQILLRADDGKSLLMLRPEKTYENTDLTMINQWCQISSLKIDNPEWFPCFTEEFIKCLIFSTKLPQWGAVTINLMEPLKRAMAAIKEYESQFAEDWLFDMLKQMSCAFKKENIRPWFVHLIVEQIGKGMDRKLVKCLPALEEFNELYNPLDKHKSCIEAYIQLLKGDCDFEMCQKALKQAVHLNRKVHFLSNPMTHDFGPDEACVEEGALNFAEKFEFICKATVKKMVDDLCETGETDEFLSRLRFVKENTVETFKLLQGRNRVLPVEIFRIMNEYFHLFKEERVLNEVFDWLLKLKRTLPLTSWHRDRDRVLSEVYLIELALFHGAMATEKYLIENRMGNNVLEWNEEDLNPYYCLYYIMGDSARPSPLHQKIRMKVLQDQKFSKEYHETLRKYYEMFQVFKTLRPALAESWYDKWRFRILALISFDNMTGLK